MYHPRSNLRVPEVSRRTGARRTTLYKWVREGLLTPPIRWSARFSFWPSDEIDEIVSAHAASASKDDLRKLVRDLVAKRQKLPSAAEA